MELIDTHAHLSAPEFSADIEDVISRAKANSVNTIISIGAGYGIESAKKTVELSEKFEEVVCSVGLHPHNAAEDITQITDLKKLALHPKVVAIGETGLDYFRDWAPKDSQIKWFRLQIELALELKKPIIIHSREAGEDCFNILKEMNAGDVGGVFHCFAEDEKFAARLENINFLVSFPGTITFKKSDPLRQIVKNIPLERIMIETDAPFMAPEPNRGKRCESSFVLDTAKKMAEIKGISLDELASITTKTAKTLFRL